MKNNFKLLNICWFLFIWSLSSLIPLNGQNNALNFDGIDNFVDLGNIGGIGGDLHLPGTHTLEAWVNVNSFSTLTSTIIRNGSSATDEQYSLLIDNLGRVQYFWFDTGSSNFLEVHSMNSLTLNTWHHVAIVRESSTTIKIYIDCVEQTIMGSTVSAGASGGQVTIGAKANSNFLFNGTIDELRVWSSARTASELATTKSTPLTGTEIGLVAYFDFNSGTAGGTNTGITTLVDKTANGNNGTLMNFNLAGTTSNWVAGAPVVVPPVVVPPVVVPAAPIPTMSQWGLLIFGLLIMNLSVFFVQRRELR